ncbi:MAG TPA: MmcQ/YjbR family DNA-binding protein [Vicinamibacterales bacterium]|nr:MmcQ/YjbR family DNA-binding protein [Vicinamibacterales bacterium]
MNAIGFRRIVLKLDGAEEREHMGHPDFRVGGRIFATLHAGYKTGAIMLAPEQQQDFVREYPSAFAPANGAWGLKGATVVTLSAVREEALGEALTLAWQRAVALGPTKSSRKPKSKK